MKLKEHNQNENRRRYRRKHPEKELQWRINASKNLLEKHGYIVTRVDKPDNSCYD